MLEAGTVSGPIRVLLVASQGWGCYDIMT